MEFIEPGTLVVQIHTVRIGRSHVTQCFGTQLTQVRKESRPERVQMLPLWTGRASTGVPLTGQASVVLNLAQG